MSDDLVVGRINFLTNEPLQVSLGGTPFNKAHLDARAAEIKRLETALTEARAEIETLESMLSDMEAMKNIYRAAAESELSTLRARVREVVGPFADLAQRYDDTVSDGWVSWAEFVADHAWPTETNCRAARQLMEEVK